MDMSAPTLESLVDSGRLFHARTALPMTREELEEGSDSDDFVDEEHWKRQCRAALDEFEDVEAVEKDFMFQWNLFVHSNCIFADALLPDAVGLFSLRHRAALAAQPGLRRCFTLHMVNLWDYGLLGGADIDRALKLIGAPKPAYSMF